MQFSVSCQKCNYPLTQISNADDIAIWFGMYSNSSIQMNRNMLKDWNKDNYTKGPVGNSEIENYC